MRIGLIDVDSHNFPNLAQMKISAYHKQRGDEVERWIGLKEYDKVYVSKVFTDDYTPPFQSVIMADEVEHGGTGYGLDNRLPEEIEHICPDYSLYGIEDTAYGFLTRGCPRGCSFCVVKPKEGTVHTVADLDEFWHGERNITLLDSAITASADCERLFDELIKSKAWIDFQSGLDVRCLTDKGVRQLNEMKIKMIHFAWDNYEFQTYDKLKKIRGGAGVS